jgi:DNA-binding GntR family transcriptional regulator
MPAGFQATEQQVAAILDMSRTPTREALLRLKSEGLVEIRPGHGMRVLPISADDMRKIYQVLAFT